MHSSVGVGRIPTSLAVPALLAGLFPVHCFPQRLFKLNITNNDAVLYHCVDFCPVIANLCLGTQFYAAFLSRLQNCPAAYALTTVAIVVKGKGKSWPSVCLFLKSLISLIMVWPPRLAARTKASSRPAVFNADVLLFPLLLPLFLLFKYANEEIFTENFSIMGGILGVVSSVDASNQVTVRSFLYIILCKSELIQVVVIWIRYTCDGHKTEGKSRSLRLISLYVVLLRLWQIIYTFRPEISL